MGQGQGQGQEQGQGQGQGPLVEEVVVHLKVGEWQVFDWRCTPRDLEALAIGRLYIEDKIADSLVASSIVIERGNDVIEILLDALPPIQSARRVRFPHIDIPPPDQFTELFRALFTGVDSRHEEGGMHAAALARGGQIVVQAEDVGRHNSVDKAIGLALLAGEDPAACGMLISSRVSGEIARKAAQCGIAWLASRSIPTTLAVQTARAAGMPIIGRAAGKNSVLYQ